MMLLDDLIREGEALRAAEAEKDAQEYRTLRSLKGIPEPKKPGTGTPVNERKYIPG